MTKKLICLACLFFSVFAWSQQKIEVQNIIKESGITTFNSQSLILIDFWATWCAPCLPATEQLQVYQSQLKNKVYMVAMSYEQDYQIKNFLKKHQIDLAVYQDFNNSNIDRFKVNYWPYSVVLDNKGKLIWSGSPTNLNVEKLNQLHASVKQRNYELSEIFHYNTAIEPEVYSKSSIDTLDVYLQKMSGSSKEKLFYKTKNRVYFKGNSTLFISHLYDVPAINIESDFTDYIEFGASLDIWENDKHKIKTLLFDELSIAVEESSQLKDAHEIKITNGNLLWDSAQINWGEDNTTNYLVGNDRIEADNFSIRHMADLLTSVKQVNYLYLGENARDYDWDFHFAYDNLMREELLYQFGVQIEPLKEMEVRILNIKKGNPK